MRIETGDFVSCIMDLERVLGLAAICASAHERAPHPSARNVVSRGSPSLTASVEPKQFAGSDDWDAG